MAEITHQQSLSRNIGWRPILEFLSGISGINENTVREDLANLKASGDYARIIQEVAMTRKRRKLWTDLDQLRMYAEHLGHLADTLSELTQERGEAALYDLKGTADDVRRLADEMSEYVTDRETRTDRISELRRQIARGSSVRPSGGSLAAAHAARPIHRRPLEDAPE
jgi:hypothetical protein